MIAMLAHEFGHIDDLHHGLNFNVERETIDLLGAEVHAERFAMDLLENRGLTIPLAVMVANVAAKRATSADSVMRRVSAHLSHSSDWPR